MNEKKRLAEIDFIKFIAMLMIVSGHAGVSFHLPIHPVHVGLFFVCSGFLLKEMEYRETVVSMIKNLYVPFVVFSLLFIAGNNFLIGHGLEVGWAYSEVQHYIIMFFHAFGMDVSEPLLGPMWFMTALFLATLIFAAARILMQKLDRSSRVPGLLGFAVTILALLGLNRTMEGKTCAWSLQNPQILNVSLVAVFCLYVGTLLRYIYIYRRDRQTVDCLGSGACFTLQAAS